jgi:hypothetical protein
VPLNQHLHSNSPIAHTDILTHSMRNQHDPNRTSTRLAAPQLRSNNEIPASLRSGGWQPCAGPGGRLQVEWVATFSGLRTMGLPGEINGARYR